MVRYWSRQEKSRKWASPSYRATQRRNSRSGRKAINCEKTVRPWFMNHCPPPQNGILKPVAVQIAARHKSRQTADWQGLVRLRKVLYRTLVVSTLSVTYPSSVGRLSRHSRRTLAKSDLLIFS